MKIYERKDHLSTFYYKDEQCTILHREDGPAKIYKNGDKEWFINGVNHRDDGPAAEYVCGEKVWYKNGQRHREDGPAIEYFDGHGLYFLHNIHYKQKDYWAIIRLGTFA